VCNHRGRVGLIVLLLCPSLFVHTIEIQFISLDKQRLEISMRQEYEQKNTSSNTTEQLIDQIKTLEDFSFDKNRYYVLIDLAKVVPVYVSSNIINQGYTQEEFYNLDLSKVEKYLSEEHANIKFKFPNWQKRFYQKIEETPSSKDKFIICGIQIKNKWNRINSFVVKGRMLSDAIKNDSFLCFLEITEISSLYTGDLYWTQYKVNRDKNTYSRVYFSSGKKKEAPNILTSREMKIVDLIAKNYPSSEIAEQLEVSLETIKKHRKNMLAKTKVKDITSLIQLLTICDIPLSSQMILHSLLK